MSSGLFKRWSQFITPTVETQRYPAEENEIYLTREGFVSCTAQTASFAILLKAATSKGFSTVVLSTFVEGSGCYVAIGLGYHQA